ncbi:MAG: hypothetical protein ABGY75_04260 [Gemmataceae bacterium]
MRVAFTADEVGVETDEYAVVCGVAGGGKWLTFQRDAEGSADEDWGVHLEYADQANGDYACVTACRLGPASLSVDLGRQLGSLAGVTGFDVSLHLSPQAWEELRAGLRQVFRGQLDRLAGA